jgi:hypothetical protein
VSEDESVDAAGTPGAPVTQSLGEAPPTTSVPKQTLGAAPAEEAAPSVPVAHVQEAAPASAPEAATEAAPEKVEQSAGPAPTTPAEPVQVLGTAPLKRRRGLLGGAIFAVVVVVLLGAIGFLVYQRLNGDPTKNAAAGQCLAGLPEVGPGQDQEATGGKVVDCGDSSAVYRIESRLDNQDAAQAKSVDVCKGSPEATVIYRAVPDTGTGYVLCLKKLG